MERKKKKKEKRKRKEKEKKKKLEHNMVVLNEKNVLVFATNFLLNFFRGKGNTKVRKKILPTLSPHFSSPCTGIYGSIPNPSTPQGTTLFYEANHLSLE